MFRKALSALGTSLILCSLSVAWLVTAQSPFLGVQDAWADPYFNSSEPMCNGSDPTVLMCDDFEDGNWAMTHCDDPDQSQNDGWCGTIFYGGYPDPQGTGFGRCGGLGVVGTDCVAYSGVLQGTGTTTQGFMGNHTFTGNRGVDEIYVRWYVKALPGFSFGHMKQLFLQDWVLDTWQCCALDSSVFGNPTPALISMIDDVWLTQNQGNPLTMVPGRWYYIEVHAKLNTVGKKDGIYELWMDDCGTNGLGCNSSGTLRARHTTNTFRTSSTQQIHMIWLENWGNPGSQGELYYDQIVAATRRIGPMGVTLIAPGAPANLRVLP